MRFNLISKHTFLNYLCCKKWAVKLNSVVVGVKSLKKKDVLDKGISRNIHWERVV